MHSNDSNDSNDTNYHPHFEVTQEVYDKATPEERTKFNYIVVDDAPLELPKTFSIPRDLEPNE
jgi:hypothetical protein